VTTILVTGVGGPTPRACCISLRRFGKGGPYRIIATDCQPIVRGLYDTDLHDAAYLVPAASEPGYREAIESVVQEENVDLALVQPEQEVEVWAMWARAGVLPAPTFLPPASAVSVLRDKLRVARILEESGAAPLTMRVDPGQSDFGRLAAILGVPFWVRAVEGSSAKGALMVTEENDLRRWAAGTNPSDRYAGSTYLPGRNLAVKLLFRRGELVRAAVGERIAYVMANIAPSGITGNTSYGRLLNEPQLVDAAAAALSTVFESLTETPHGFFTVDLKETADGRPLVTEINVRHVAFTSSFAAAGANLVEDVVRLTRGEQLRQDASIPYRFEGRPVFLRDVDAEPLLIDEAELVRRDAARSAVPVRKRAS